jgi:hypothetical protein
VVDQRQWRNAAHGGMTEFLCRVCGTVLRIPVIVADVSRLTLDEFRLLGPGKIIISHQPIDVVICATCKREWTREQLVDNRL